MALSGGTLLPAYGRDYDSKKDAITDFRNGKDFLFTAYGNTTYCSIRNAGIGELVKIRYQNGDKACFYTVTQSDFMKGSV